MKRVSFFLFFFLFVPNILYSTEATSSRFPQKNAHNRIFQGTSFQLQQVASFKLKTNAERFVKKLRNGGQEALIRKAITKDNKIFYRVFVKKFKDLSKEELSLSGNNPPSPPPPKADKGGKGGFSGEMKQIASFKIFNEIEDAENFATQLRKEGYDVTIRSNVAKDNNLIYTVFAERYKEQSKGILSSGGIKYETTPENLSIEEKPVEKERPSLEHKELSEEEKPIGTVKERPSEDVFGKRGGFLHPFLSITEYYTDNVFYSNDNKKSDFITVLSPGIWLTIPHVYEKLLQIDTSNLSPGGFSLSRYKPETFRRYQTYLFYNADIEQFSKYSSENAVNHKAEGLFQYNLRGGLSIELLDQFMASHDDRGTGISTQLDKFRTNLANVILTYDVSEKLRFRIDYSNFLVNYIVSRNNFRDRYDNAFSGYVFFKFQPKTSLFIEYEFIDIRYDTDTLSNSKEHNYFGGIQWDITAKSKGSIKAGYGAKDFIDPAIKKGEDFILEAQIDHKFTPKTSLIFKASRRTNETNLSTTDFILSNAIEVEYLQRITGKITADVKLSYINDTYKGDFTYNGGTKPLKENYYQGAFALQYKFKEWLEMDIGYIYTKRDSNFSDFDYTTNIVFIRITGSL